MIPKKIHYCWFGDRDLGDLENRCLESWKKIFPDYEIIKWGNDCLNNFDNKYLRQAVEAKKWAFVSDYVRLYALLEHGGLYFDTDEEVLKPLDDFMDHDFFMGSQRCGSCRTVSPALIGTTANNQIVRDLLSIYDNEVFIKEDGSFNMTTNPEFFNRILKDKYGIDDTFVTEGRLEICENSYIYPYYFFCTQNKLAYAVHHYSGSWRPAWKVEEKLSFKLGKNSYSIKKYKKLRDEDMPLEVGEKVVASIKTNKRSKFVLIKK